MRQSIQGQRLTLFLFLSILDMKLTNFVIKIYFRDNLPFLLIATLKKFHSIKRQQNLRSSDKRHNFRPF